MHVCVYACMYVCVYARVHVGMYACRHVCICACIHVCMYGEGESDSARNRVISDPTPFPRGVGGAPSSRGRRPSGRSKGDVDSERGGAGGFGLGAGGDPSPGMDFEVVTADMQLGEGNKGKKMLKGMGWEDGKVGI